MTRRAGLIAAAAVVATWLGGVALVNHYDMLQPWLTVLDTQILEARDNLGRWPSDLEEIRANALTQTRQLDGLESVVFVSRGDSECRYVVRGRNLIGFPFEKERNLSVNSDGTIGEGAE